MTEDAYDLKEQGPFEPDIQPLDSYSKGDLLRVIERTILRMDHFEEKYYDLVWYARKDEAMRHGAVGNKMQQIENNYIDDMYNLDTNPDWQHGFNSGCLAAVRLFQEYLGVLQNTDIQRQHLQYAIQSGIEEGDGTPQIEEADVLDDAEEEFPFLDT